MEFEKEILCVISHKSTKLEIQKSKLI